jgi:hypothetical protein
MMKLNAPKNITWIIALVLGLLAILSRFTSLPLITENNFWVLAIGWALLVLATYLKDL